jgi:tRNA A-37 threonylcarbamoyl transferase component Bud32/lipopolysaccharide biosynthesis regulator YciM
VSIQYPVELRGTFRVRLATKKNQWRRKSPEAIRAEILKGGTSSRTEHHLVSRETQFRRIPARRYFASVEGILQDPESGEMLVDAYEKKITRVRHRRTVRIEFDVSPSDCPVDVRVLWDGKPPREALLSTSSLPGGSVDASAGPVRLSLPLGGHRLVVGSGDRVVERQIELTSFRPSTVSIDIADASRVIFKGCPPAVEAYLSGDMQGVARALERDGQADQAHLLLARMYRDQGQAEPAARHFEAAEHPLEAAQLRASIRDFSGAAELFEVAGEPLRAAEMYRAAGELARAGEAFEAARDFDQAIQCYRESGELSKCVDALDRRGDTFAAAQLALDNGWRARAIRLLRLVTPEDARFAEACALLSDAFEREGHYDLAAQKLEEQIAASGPGAAPADLHSRLAELVEQTGNNERALSLLEDLRRREPTYPNIATRIELLRKKRSSMQPVLTDAKVSSGADYAPTMFLSDYRYEILEEIGRGAMGVVFKARDRRLSRVVALKRLPESLKNYPRAVQLFLREAQSTAKLNHPNIVTVFDADQEDGQFFITMELLEGQPLHGVIRERGPLEVEEVVRLGIQVADGLHYAHSQKVVHRDVKTANLFLTREGTLKIMDFGLAKTLEEVRRAETGIGGTPFYMAPEQVAGGDVDHRADLYSLGATLFELATGSVPFPEGDVTYHHRHTPAPDPRDRRPELPAELAELCLYLLEKRLEERCPSAAVARERLEQLLGVRAL